MTHQEWQSLLIELKRAQENYESGRSMVEMLGVLAIVGVLSVGAIAGYTMAMNKYRANELMDGASKRAIVASQQLALGKEPENINFNEFSDNDMGFGVFSDSPYAVEGTSGGYAIEVLDVPKDVCKKLIPMSSNSVGIAKVVDWDIVDITSEECEDKNDLVFVYHKSESGMAIADPRKKCGQYGVYKNGACECVDGFAGPNCDTIPALEGCTQNDCEPDEGESVGYYLDIPVIWNGNKCVPLPDDCRGGRLSESGLECICDSCHYGFGCEYPYDGCSA